MGTSTTYTINGRNVYFYAPTGIAANAPLVLVLHPGNSNASTFRTTTALDAEADAGLFYCAYIDGTGNPAFIPASKSWNSSGDSGLRVSDYANYIRVNDVRYIRLIKEYLLENYSINSSKIHILGYSLGCMMGYYYLTQYPSDIKSATMVAGCFNGPRLECTQAIAKTVMHIYGTTDTTVPPSGGASDATNIYRVGNPAYQFPALTEWQTFLKGKGVTFNNVTCTGVGHLLADLNTYLSADTVTSRVGDMVAGTGTWA